MTNIVSTATSQSIDDSTIAAIATPPGPGGIGIIRISGNESLSILNTIFSAHNSKTPLTSHRLTYGWITNPQTKQPIDEVLVVFMRAPKTYTREDIVEIHCHGSYLVLQNILNLIVALGAKLADPGEFTKRAFLNGRIDLTQAEAVIELLQAKTHESLDMAISQLGGGLRDIIAKIRHSLMSLRAIIEVAIDFPDDDIEIINPKAMASQLEQEIINPLQQLINSANHGKIFREGISVIILGKPNVGKSSLLNALLREDRAIVTEIPGTTRDTIEECLDIKGLPVRIIDTAGIRENAEKVEKIGIQRAREKLSQADLVLLICDGSHPLTSEDTKLYLSIQNKPVLLVVNKIDVASPDRDFIRSSFPEATPVFLSAKTNEGLADLEDALFTTVTGEPDWDPGHECVPNVRQHHALQGALSAAKRLNEGLTINLPPDLLAIELQTALDQLGDIIGETTTEDILDLIFEQFCIGK